MLSHCLQLKPLATPSVKTQRASNNIFLKKKKKKNEYKNIIFQNATFYYFCIKAFRK